MSDMDVQDSYNATHTEGSTDSVSKSLPANSTELELSLN